MQHDHKEGVQRKIQDTRDEKAAQRSARIAQRAQDRRAHIVDELGAHAAGDDAQIGRGQRMNGLRAAEQAQQDAGGKITERGKQQPCGEHHAENAGHRLPQLPAVARSEEPGGHRADAGGEADEEVDQHAQQQSGDPRGGQRAGLAEVSQHGAVRGVVELLQHLRRQHRKGKGQQRFPDGPFVHMHGLLHRFTTLCFHYISAPEVPI